ncbi:MAG: transposase, partial [Thermoleophilaceae bacterium]|nr:transposase [Thermoleophilaceae bacterium]
LARAERAGGETIVADKGYAGRAFALAASELQAKIVRPARRDEPQVGPRLSRIRQRVESIFWTCKDLLTLERHGARTLGNLRVRIAQRFLALAAAIALNHQLGRPSRALVAYVA